MISRGFSVFRAGKLLHSASKLRTGSIRNSAHAAWNYRVAAPPASKTTLILADIIQGTAWWWILWHLYTEYEHITGEFEYPDPSKWTDEELGIPPE